MATCIICGIFLRIDFMHKQMYFTHAYIRACAQPDHIYIKHKFFYIHTYTHTCMCMDTGSVKRETLRKEVQLTRIEFLSHLRHHPHYQGL